MTIPKFFWLYLRGISSSQNDRPFNLDQKCPSCQESFSIEDKIGALPCNETHWYHRSCLKEIIENNREEGEYPSINCGHCESLHFYPTNDKEEEKPEEEAAPEEGEATPEGEDVPAE